MHFLYLSVVIDIGLKYAHPESQSTLWVVINMYKTQGKTFLEYIAHFRCYIIQYTHTLCLWHPLFLISRSCTIINANLFSIVRQIAYGLPRLASTCKEASLPTIKHLVLSFGKHWSRPHASFLTCTHKIKSQEACIPNENLQGLHHQY